MAWCLCVRNKRRRQLVCHPYVLCNFFYKQICGVIHFFTSLLIILQTWFVFVTVMEKWFIRETILGWRYSSITSVVSSNYKGSLLVGYTETYLKAEKLEVLRDTMSYVGGCELKMIRMWGKWCFDQMISVWLL